jgi:hypothetical protein
MSWATRSGPVPDPMNGKVKLVVVPGLNGLTLIVKSMAPSGIEVPFDEMVVKLVAMLCKTSPVYDVGFLTVKLTVPFND